MVQVTLHLHRRLHLHVVLEEAARLPPNEAWLLVFFALVLTADFIRVSVTVVEMMRMRPTVSQLSAQCVIACGFSHARSRSLHKR